MLSRWLMISREILSMSLYNRANTSECSRKKLMYSDHNVEGSAMPIFTVFSGCSSFKIIVSNSSTGIGCPLSYLPTDHLAFPCRSASWPPRWTQWTVSGRPSQVPMRSMISHLVGRFLLFRFHTGLSTTSEQTSVLGSRSMWFCRLFRCTPSGSRR